MSQFGKFNDLCRDSTLPVCNVFLDQDSSVPLVKSCPLVGFEAGGNPVGNLGSIIFACIAIIVAGLLLWMSEKKQAAVGRREMQILLVAYMIVSLAEIFTIGGVIENREVLVWFTGLHIGAITATFWILLLNAIVGYQLLDDGTPLSIGLVGGSALIVFLGTGYITMDTALEWTDEFIVNDQLRNYALYILYLIFPLIALAGYFILESVLVLHVLAEKRPMVLLGGSAALFVVAQIFQFVASVHICHATDGKIDGSMFSTLFTLLSVVTLWFFWSSITEDVWVDEPMTEGYGA